MREKAKWCVCIAGRSINLCDIVCAGSRSLLKMIPFQWEWSVISMWILGAFCSACNSRKSSTIVVVVVVVLVVLVVLVAFVIVIVGSEHRQERATSKRASSLEIFNARIRDVDLRAAGDVLRVGERWEEKRMKEKREKVTLGVLACLPWVLQEMCCEMERGGKRQDERKKKKKNEKSDAACFSVFALRAAGDVLRDGRGGKRKGWKRKKRKEKNARRRCVF